MKGFILTRQWRDTPRGIEYDFWLAGEKGPLCLTVSQQQAVAFFRQADLKKIQVILHLFPSVSFQALSLKNFHSESVMALYCQQQRQLRDIHAQCEQQGIPLWEADIKPHERFLMERFITSSLEIPDHYVKHSDKVYSAKTDHVRATDYRPDFKVISLDIETDLSAKELYSIGVYSESIAQVFMVDETLPSGETRVEKSSADAPLAVHYCSSAKQCLNIFLNWFVNYDPDIIIGWHVVQFDLRVLAVLCQHCGIDFLLGRNKQKIHWRQDADVSDADAKENNNGRYYAQIPGRVVLDGIELLRMAFYHFDSFSLDFVASSLLGDSKLIKGSQRADTITKLFQHNKPALAAYNLQDCELVWRIFEKTKLIDFVCERSRLTGLAMDRIGGSVASFDYAYLPRLHRRGYVAPRLGELLSDIVSPGGYVMRSKPGLYRDILVLDFKSLYPSIIRTFLIDPYAFWLAEHQQLSSNVTVEGFNGARFARKDAILPDLIKELWDARDEAKRDKNQPLSQAIKIIMNSFYGVLGSNGCRFFDPRVCSSITLRGHEIIQRSRDWIVEQGYDVIYGDTDSLFIHLKKPLDSNVDFHPKIIGAELAERLNTWWKQDLRQRFDIESALEVEFETHYTHFFMPTIRGSSEGSKKRYAGMVRTKTDSGDEERLVFKGLETVRNDWTALAKAFQQELYLKVFKQERYQEMICRTVEDLLAAKLDEHLVYQKKLRRPLSTYTKSNPPHIKAARYLQRINGKALGKGEQVRYVITVNGPEPISDRMSQIDYQHYIDKQLKPIADSILVFVNDRFESIIDQQLSLL